MVHNTIRLGERGTAEYGLHTEGFARKRIDTNKYGTCVIKRHSEGVQSVTQNTKTFTSASKRRGSSIRYGGYTDERAPSREEPVREVVAQALQNRFPVSVDEARTKLGL